MYPFELVFSGFWIYTQEWNRCIVWWGCVFWAVPQSETLQPPSKAGSWVHEAHGHTARVWWHWRNWTRQSGCSGQAVTNHYCLFALRFRAPKTLSKAGAGIISCNTFLKRMHNTWLYRNIQSNETVKIKRPYSGTITFFFFSSSSSPSPPHYLSTSSF